MAAVHTLARWCNTFNVWEWPVDYPRPKPEVFDQLPNRDREGPCDKFRVIEPHTMSLRIIVPHKEIMRDWHCRHLSHTDDEFEAWWAETHANADL